jgi:hypothetical protein
MATISKQGIGHKPPINDHIGEDKSFGRASRLLTVPRKPGLNPHNAVACDDPVFDADAVSAPKPVQTSGHTRH